MHANLALLLLLGILSPSAHSRERSARSVLSSLLPGGLRSSTAQAHGRSRRSAVLRRARAGNRTGNATGDPHERNDERISGTLSQLVRTIIDEEDEDRLNYRYEFERITV